MTEILTVIGTRPEIIRMSCIIPHLDRKFDHDFVFTSQHYSRNMCEIFFKELGVRMPDRFLELKTSDITHLTNSTYAEIKRVNPEYVLVYGDTNSTLAGARAAKKAKVKIIHIESGFRSFDGRMHEEYNRIQVDRISDILFTPTAFTKNLLLMEGIQDNVFAVGDVTIDALKRFSGETKKRRIIDKLGLKKEEYILFTAHRQENVDKPKRLLKIIDSLKAVDRRIVYPVHPRTRKMLDRFRIKLPENVIATQPLGYFDFLNLEKHSSVVITDSGGVQGEAFAFKIPCITIRETTERWETITLGANFLAGVDPLAVGYYNKMIAESNLKKKLKKIRNPYGDGRTSNKIAKKLKGII